MFIVDDALDTNQANDMCLKNLNYILRIQMSDQQLFTQLMGESTTEEKK